MAKRPGKKAAAPKGKAKTAASKASSQHRGTNGPGAHQHGDAAGRLRAALLAELSTLGWRDLSFADIVEASGLTMAEAYGAYQSKIGILRGIVQATDQALLESLASDPLDGSVRDRLFDLIMRRLDQHADHKPAFSALFGDLRHHPAESLCLATRLQRSMAMLLDLAGLSSSGIRGLLRMKALSALYLHVFRTWLKDESADSATTMALLDKRLDQAERLLGFVKRVRPGRADASKSEAGSHASSH